MLMQKRTFTVLAAIGFMIIAGLTYINRDKSDLKDLIQNPVNTIIDQAGDRIVIRRVNGKQWQNGALTEHGDMNRIQNQLISLLQKLNQGMLSRKEYLEQLQDMGKHLTGGDIVVALGVLKQIDSDGSSLLSLLAGAAESDLKTTLKLVDDEGLLIGGKLTSDAELLKFTGKLCYEMISTDSPLLDEFLEARSDAASIRRSALRELVSAQGLDVAIMEVAKPRSAYSGTEPFKGVFIITESVEASGWKALATLSSRVVEANVPALCMKPVAEAMAKASPELTFDYLKALPVSDKRSLAMNGFFKVIAETDPESALQYVTQISSDKHEQINALLALHGTFSAKHQSELADECAELLKTKGIEPP
jgi:hypothetical protein